MRILLVEDDLQICKVIQKYFSDQGAEMTSITDGQSALQLAEQGLGAYSLVLLDIMLPGADGFTICRSITNGYPMLFRSTNG